MATRLILLGPPASGKGTQGRRLAESLRIAYLGTGALLREAVERGTDLGAQAKPILERGGYLPDDLMNSILGEWLKSHGEGSWILDGFPRSLAQAEYLAAWLKERELGLDASLYLEVPQEDLLKRIRGRVECPECRWTGQIADLNGADRCPECGGVPAARADDTEENFRSRYQEFVTHTLPVVEWYEAAGKLHRCDATRRVDVVAKELFDYSRSLKSHGQAA